MPGNGEGPPRGSWTGRDGILILTSGSGCILEVDPFLTDLLGVSRETLCGREFGEVGIFEDQARVAALFEEVQREGYAHCDDLVMRGGEGGPIHVDFVGNSYLVDKTVVIQFNLCERR
jgi:PAS domain-containing protein